ncbi:uncharacterized protein LOC143149813 isoform X1 [Ptiloglossa arizonensis]|uniref:uncharacterized protein LOC143149813 isoform X1 n=1 Tax=Ptiloglossa arizonensis TaxID=3350558 RepID=UPI003FA0686D
MGARATAFNASLVTRPSEIYPRAKSILPQQRRQRRRRRERQWFDGRKRFTDRAATQATYCRVRVESHRRPGNSPNKKRRCFQSENTSCSSQKYRVLVHDSILVSILHRSDERRASTMEIQRFFEHRN